MRELSMIVSGMILGGLSMGGVLPWGISGLLAMAIALVAIRKGEA